jgi:hypothetical protein
MVKAEMQRDEENGVVKLAFECSREEDHEVLDAIRVAMLGSHEKEGGYINSNRFVVHVKEKK